MPKQLPQNIKQLLSEIGEKTVLFRLYLLTKNTKWEVYKNLNEIGCDIILFNNETSNKIKIEVKTRQRLYTTSRHRFFDFALTENEYNNAGFLIGYWYDKNYFFIVPTKELKATLSNNNKKYKLRIKYNVDSTLCDTSKKYLNRWNFIENELKTILNLCKNITQNINT
ncbi:DUF3883 domain-containing protein [Candidatus Parcubacteria bacterium]|nr:DUF3883 domain-containing protein [Candidatus Parcubacteria bacterium]